MPDNYKEIDYELAEKLKDAKFPFLKPVVEDGEIRMYPPTLEELVYACGKNFRSLMLHGLKPLKEGHIKSYGEGMVWQAKPNKVLTPKKIKSCWGKTPIEAMAKLWLKLNNGTT